VTEAVPPQESYLNNISWLGLAAWLSNLGLSQEPKRPIRIPTCAETTANTNPANKHSSPSLSSSSERLFEILSSEKKPQYSKLQALGKLVAVGSHSGTNVVQAGGLYLQLVHSTEYYEKGLETLLAFNACLESPDVSGGQGQLDSYALSIRVQRTRWAEFEPLIGFRQLFRTLCNKVSTCAGVEKHKHQAMIRLNGFQLEEHPLAFDMFLFPCRRPQYCQQCRLMKRTT
jgi:hypothetical protein